MKQLVLGKNWKIRMWCVYTSMSQVQSTKLLIFMSGAAKGGDGVSATITVIKHLPARYTPTYDSLRLLLLLLYMNLLCSVVNCHSLIFAIVILFCCKTLDQAGTLRMTES